MPMLPSVAREFVALLRCPETGSRLELCPEGLRRSGDGVVYPVRDGIAELVPEGAEACFSPQRLARIGELDAWHFWFVGRAALVDGLLAAYLGEPGVVLDLGCGNGGLLSVLARRGHRAIGVDLLGEGLVQARRREPDAWLARAEAGRLPFADGVLDAVLALDVLEHVDDRRVLAEIRRVLRPGGALIAAAPAAPWLWSYRDEDAGHRRRYSRSQLVRLLSHAGFQREELRYYQSLLFPLVVATRLLGRRGPTLRDLEERPRRRLNTILGRITSLELALSRRVRLPWGLSLVTVARKGRA
jgi:SAM-dependent methyltransferase